MCIPSMDFFRPVHGYFGVISTSHVWFFLHSFFSCMILTLCTFPTPQNFSNGPSLTIILHKQSTIFFFQSITAFYQLKITLHVKPQIHVHLVWTLNFVITLEDVVWMLMFFLFTLLSLDVVFIPGCMLMFNVGKESPGLLSLADNKVYR